MITLIEKPIHVLHQETVKELVEANLAREEKIVDTLLENLKAHRPTYEHSQRTACYFEKFIEFVQEVDKEEDKPLRFSQQTKQRVGRIAKVHDIGKLFILELVDKTEDFTQKDGENLVELHTTYGANILAVKYQLPEEYVATALFHHENFIGNGRPFQLKGEKIPILASAFSVIDRYDAAGTRTHKAGMIRNSEAVFQDINSTFGKELDPQWKEPFRRFFNWHAMQGRK